MASTADFTEYVCGQLSGAGEIRARKMFGEYGLYCGEKFFALICDNQLFVKPTAAGRKLLASPDERPPYDGAKPYFLVEDLEDAAFLARLTAATCAELPDRKVRAAKSNKKK